MTSSPSIIVMTKAPRPGTVKTRLQPGLDSNTCSSLQKQLIVQTVHTARKVANVYVAFHPRDAAEELKEIVAGTITAFPQSDGNIGVKMAHAVEHVLSIVDGPLLVIGTDIPTLNEGHLNQAFRHLEDGSDVVLGPSNDGGYYLVGLSKAIPDLFDLDSEHWSGPTVLEETLEKAKTLNLNVSLIEALIDLDTANDLEQLRRDPNLPHRIRQIFDSRIPEIPLDQMDSNG